MKKTLLSILTLFITITAFAQAPDLVNYQAIIRNSAGNLVQDSNIGMRVSILQTSITGTAVYTETHTASTNVNGLVTIQIGGGTTSNDFSTIDWSTGPYFIKTETDIAGGTNYTIEGTSQLLSVPYALHAKTASTISSDSGELSDIQISNDNIVQTSNYLVFDGFDDIVHVFNSNSGTWASQTINQNVTSSSVFSSNGNFLVFDAFDDIVYTYSHTEETWSSQTVNLNVTSNSINISEGNFLIFDAFDDVVYVFNNNTATWASQTINQNVNSSSIFSSNGNFLVFDAFDDVVYAFNDRMNTWTSQTINQNVTSSSISASNGNFLVFDAFDDAVYTYSNVAGTWSSQTINQNVTNSSIFISGN